jgi:hypothetical protein
VVADAVDAMCSSIQFKDGSIVAILAGIGSVIGAIAGAVAAAPWWAGVLLGVAVLGLIGLVVYGIYWLLSQIIVVPIEVDIVGFGGEIHVGYHPAQPPGNGGCNLL